MAVAFAGSQKTLMVGMKVSLDANFSVLPMVTYHIGQLFIDTLLADWLRNGLRYSRDDVFRAPTFRPGMVTAWLVGFALYEWIAQTQGLGFWSSWLARLHPPTSGIGASLPSFAASFLLASAVAGTARMRRSA